MSLGPEMKSTGEVMGADYKYHLALYKALVAAGSNFSDKESILITVTKREAVTIAKELVSKGYEICATLEII